MFSLKRTLADLRLFGKGYLRNRIGLFFGLIFPVILILIFGAIFSGGSNGPFPLYVQNNDGGQVSTSLISVLNGTDTVRVKLVSSSENFSNYLSVHSISDGLIIPANFTASYIAGAPINVTIYRNPSSSSSAVVQGTTFGVLNSFNFEYYAHNSPPIIGAVLTTANSQIYRYVDFLIPGLIGFSILVSPMFSLVNISSEYKKIKLFKQLSLTPLTKLEWLGSKVIFYIFLSSVSFLLMVGVGSALFKANVVLSLWLIPFLILGPMLFSSLGMLVGTVSRNTETASVIGNVVTFPMMFLSGTFFPVASMPMYLQAIAHVLPLYYIIDGLNAVMIYSNYSAALLDIGIVTVITVAAFVIAARLFKWRED
jgi:ABC-2 type transport system permease protein